MTFHIIIKGESENRKRIKGKSVSELGRNLESEGWPSEFKDEGERDKVAFIERKLCRPLTRRDLKTFKG